MLAVGDGGYAMNLGELATAVREGLPLLVLVLDDGAYGAEYYKLEHFGVDPAHSRLQSPDFVEVARAMGGDGTTARRLEDLDAVGKVAQDLRGPYVVDVRLDAAVTSSTAEPGRAGTAAYNTGIGPDYRSLSGAVFVQHPGVW